jgi:glycosyltransferase involved in cell wall biosynthesis
VNILAFIQPGTNSRSIMLDCARGFEKAGHRLFLWELAPMWAGYQRHASIRPQLQSEFSSIVRGFIEANRIDASIGMWANTLLSLQNTMMQDGAGTRIVSFFDAIDHPHALLWLDAPHWAHAGDFAQHFGTSLVRQRRIYHVINNAATGKEMSDVLGFTNVLPRRYGVNQDIFRPHDLEKAFDIVFGSGPGDPPPTPAVLAELETDDPDMGLVRREAAAAVEQELDAIAGPRDGLRRVLRSLIGIQLENRDEPMLDRLVRLRAMEPSLSTDVDALKTDPRLFVKATMAIRGVERFERAFTISYLSRRFRCATFGTGNFAAWGCRAHSFGELTYEDQAKAYSRGRIGLNVGRWQDDAGLNLKPLEITASGVACLCAWRTGFDDVLTDGVEAVSFRGPRDAADKVRAVLDSPSRLAEMAQTGRARTLRDHTWETWARDILTRLVPARQ